MSRPPVCDALSVGRMGLELGHCVARAGVCAAHGRLTNLPHCYLQSTNPIKRDPQLLEGVLHRPMRLHEDSSMEARIGA